MQSPLVIVLAKLFLPLAFWWGYYDAVELDELSRRRLVALRGQRAIFCANHSKGHDPGIIYYLRKYLRENLRFLAAREIFDRWHGLLGWLIQRIGAFSVERSVPDRHAILTTVNLLLEGRHKVVVFPEGRVSNWNDHLLAVERGLTRVFLAAAAALAQRDPAASLYVVPIGLRYKYVQDISRHLNNSLLRIELALGIPEHRDDLQTRFTRVRTRVLDELRFRRPSAQIMELIEPLSLIDGTNLSQENLACGIDLVERILFGRVTQKGHRQVTVRVGAPINLSDYLVHYKANHRHAADLLARQLEQRLIELANIPQPAPTLPLSA